MSIVIPRSVWQPRHDNGAAVIGIGEWLAAGKELWLHHSITNPFGPNATLEQDCQHMRDFEAIGEARFGAGISYTWVVMPSGRVFQGHDIDRQGTHTYQRNNRSRAICLAGNYDVNALPTVMINSVALLLRELGAQLDGGHRDVYATACPGRFAYPRIGEINNLAVSGQPIQGDDAEVLSPEAQQWMRENLMGTVTVPLLQSMAARIEGLAKTIGEAQSGPDTGETLQGPIDINLTKWRLFNLLLLNEEGTQDRADGEEYPFVAAFNALVASVEQIKADVAELKEGA